MMGIHGMVDNFLLPTIGQFAMLAFFLETSNVTSVQLQCLLSLTHVFWIRVAYRECAFYGMNNANVGRIIIWS